MKSPYHGMVDIPVTLSCGCEIKWKDGFDLFEPGQTAYCLKHGDVDIETIDAIPERFWKIEKCPDGSTDFESLMRMIASGEHDIDIEDFARRLDLPEGWDWGDIEDRIQRGMWTAEFIDATIHRGLIG